MTQNNGENNKVNLTIDGVPVSVEPGTLIIEAALKAGIYIPRFCYHKLLKPYAGCRMCLVEIPKGSERDPRPFPKPQPSCAIPVQEGMAVETQSDSVNAIRQGVMEFTLINHPLDCPICDKGGECDLQDQAYLYGRDDSRFLEKKMFSRNHDLSSLIVLDYNRCILCKRCVRWTEEVADDDRLIFKHRGNHTDIATFNNTTFTSRFGGMTIELCPVGALTSKVFRFKARPWETLIRSSTCMECANGCSFNASYRNGRIMRLLSREDRIVNGPFFCDRGRFAHDFIENDDRLVKPLIREGNKFRAASWDEATEYIAKNIGGIFQENGGRSVAGMIDASQTLEALWTFRRLMKDVIGTTKIEQSPAPLGIDPDESNALLTRTPTIRQCLTSQNLVMWEADPFDDAPVLGLQLKVQQDERKINGISISSLRTFIGRHGFNEYRAAPHRRLAILAGIISRAGAEAGSLSDELKSVVNAANSAAANLTADEKSAVDKTLAHLKGDDAVLIIGAPLVRTAKNEIAALIALISIIENIVSHKVKVLPLYRGANSLAALLIGLRTQVEEGGPLKFSGDNATTWADEVEKGRIKAIFAIGDGLNESIGEKGLDKLSNLDFLAVVTDFMNPLAARADVVLPGVASWELSGTSVNFDGTIRKLNEIVNHPTGAWKLENVFSSIARHLETEISADHHKIHAELGAFHRAFKPLADPKSEKIDIATEGKFRFSDAEKAFGNLNAPSDGNYGVIINETVWQHDTRGYHSEQVSQMPEEFCVGLSKKDASSLGVKPGDTLKISTSAGSLTAPVKTVKVPDGYVLLPVGYRDNSLADLGLIRKPQLTVSLERVESEVAIA
ncbi:MAG TPA: NADH-quinone oxidoreductase subunit NuoG [bacterium]|jgi:NADH-quinone oxidoreductase subunit G